MKQKIFFTLSTILILTTVFVVFSGDIAVAQEGGTSSGATETGGGTSSGATEVGGGTSRPTTHSIKFDNPLTLGEDATISSFIAQIINNIIVPIGAVVSVVFIIYAGFLFVTARGSEDKLKSAKTALLNAVIGTLIILGAWTFAQVIEGTVNQLGGPLGLL